MSEKLAPVAIGLRNLRHLWLRVHRWVALGVGWILVLSGLTGAALVVLQPLDQRLHPEFFQSRTAYGKEQALSPLEPIRKQLAAEFGKKSALTFRPPREPNESLRVLVRGQWSGTVYIDPVTGTEQGRRGDTEGVLNTLFKFHSSLWLQETGKAILAWVALAYLFLLVTGLILWWPRQWPPSWRIELRRGSMRALLDLHRVGGAAIGLLIAVSVASGAYMAWRPLGTWVTTLSGAEPVKAPKLPKTAASDAAPLPIDVLVAHAQARFPDGAIGYVQVQSGAGPVRVRMHMPDDPHPNGLTSVWLHPQTGAILAAHRWNELDPGARAVAVVYPLHTGELGGVLLETIVALGGLVLGTLGISGIWLWWKRRALRR